MSLLLIILVAFLSSVTCQIYCEEGYTCFEQPEKEIVWVMKDAGNVHGPNCASMCSTALCGTGSFYACDNSVPATQTPESFSPIATGLGFSCVNGGCWDSKAPGVGMMMVSIDGDSEKRCYYPEESSFNCNANPGNANCYGERYSIICPCSIKPLDQACPWSAPPNNAQLATWTNEEGTTCLERINYWRRVACEEGWPECPPCGLPPMIECVGCHECANSQAQYDSQNGAHASFKRCGDMVQGEGGGSTCANVIDAFVSERQVFDDSNGTVVCRGHCGPIVKPGCLTFFWGRAQTSNFHTLNWRTCNAEKCQEYCDNPTDNECFTHPDSPCVPPCLDPLREAKIAAGVAIPVSIALGVVLIAIIVGVVIVTFLPKLKRKNEQE